MGGQYRYEDLQDQGNQLNVANRANQLTRWSWAMFVEDEWSLTDTFALTGGVRMDQDQNYGTHWSPRLYGVWHLADSWTLKGVSPPAIVHRICACRPPTGARPPVVALRTACWSAARN